MGKNNHAGKIIGVVFPMLGLALGEYIPLCYMQDAFKAFDAERITGNMANASKMFIRDRPMGKGIKTRVSEKKGIKAIDKAAVASERMKEAYIRTKDKADHSLYAEESIYM